MAFRSERCGWVGTTLWLLGSVLIDALVVLLAFGIGDRIIVLMTHNTDVSNAWERETEDSEYFYRFSIDGYAVGINVLLYAMTH
jgi:hypothetical protein